MLEIGEGARRRIGDRPLRRGDLIISVNNQLVTSPAQVIAAVDAARRRFLG